MQAGWLPNDSIELIHRRDADPPIQQNSWFLERNAYFFNVSMRGVATEFPGTPEN